MAQYSQITYNGINLNVLSVTPKKVQKSIKQVLGKSLIQTRVIGLASQQWELDISGKVTGTTASNLSTNRANIENLNDVTVHAYVDGIHDGNYYLVPESLQFNDVGDDANSSYTYGFTLIEE